MDGPASTMNHVRPLPINATSPIGVSRRAVISFLLLLIGLTALKLDTLGVKSMESYINVDLLRGGINNANSYHELINVAEGKNTTQSSVSKNYDANLADGDIPTFSHTNDDSAWIQIDLQTSYYVHSINIFNRWCSDSDRNDRPGCFCGLSNAKVLLLDKDGVIVATRDFGNTCTVNVKTVVEDFDDGCLFETVVSEDLFMFGLTL